MAVSDWEIKDKNGNTEEVELQTDYVFEGEHSVRFLIGDGDNATAIHKQTITDAPISGALKTAVLHENAEGYFFGAVFKYQDYRNYLRVLLNNGGECSIHKVVNGSASEIAFEDLGVRMDSGTWYIYEVVCDDENNTITVRLKDADENVLAETSFSNIIPSEFKGVGGGIGLFEEADRYWFDLTKIYYP